MSASPATTVDTSLPFVSFGSTRGGQRNLLSRYMSMLRHFPPLDADEERELARRYRDEGDAEAGRRLVTAGLRLVVRIALRHGRNRTELLDLIQEGNVGLVEALHRYDPDRDVRFATYARHWVRALILKYLLDNHRLVRIGSTRAGRRLFFQLRKERRRMERDGVPVTESGLAARLGVTVEQIRAIDLHLAAPEVSLSAPACADDDGRTLSEVLPDRGIAAPEEHVARHELQALLESRFERFAGTIHDERERAIWRERALADEPETLSDIGARYGVSKERIRQLEARMKHRLRRWMESELGSDVPETLDICDTSSRAALPT